MNETVRGIVEAWEADAADGSGFPHLVSRENLDILIAALDAHVAARVKEAEAERDQARAELAAERAVVGRRPRGRAPAARESG